MQRGLEMKDLRDLDFDAKNKAHPVSFPLHDGLVPQTQHVNSKIVGQPTRGNASLFRPQKASLLSELVGEEVT